MANPKIVYRTPAVLDNPGFEIVNEGWDLSLGGWSWTNQPHTGQYSMLYNAVNGVQSALRSQSLVNVDPGDAITFSAWIFINLALVSGGIAVVLEWLAADSSIIRTDIGNFLLADGWHQSTVTNTAPANTVRVRLSILAQDPRAVSGGAVGVLIDDCALSGGYLTNELDFTYPPTQKPVYSKQATRHDTFSTAGVRQSVVLRVNETLPINVPVIVSDDVPSWQNFLDAAVAGTTFNYYPDADNSSEYYPCFLVEPQAQLQYVSPGAFSFKGTFQKEIS